MNIPPIVPSALCIVAGVLLVGETTRAYLFAGEKFDIFFFAVGLYFVGKGLFIHSVLSMLREFKNNR